MNVREESATPTDDDKLVEVTQEDRDAAAARLSESIAGATQAMIREGKMDSHGWVQAFARHRIEALKQHAPDALLLEAHDALSELRAMVRGECPSLLDEDSGGSAGLDLKIDRIRAALKGERP